WPSRARVAFAALLASELTVDAVYAAPEGVVATELCHALDLALASKRSPAVVAGTDMDEMQAAANAVSARTVALLTIIGRGAASADPTLPLRLAHRVPLLPPLSERRLQMLDGTAQRQLERQRPGGGTLRHSPGIAGVSRRGSLIQLLHTQ